MQSNLTNRSGDSTLQAMRVSLGPRHCRHDDQNSPPSRLIKSAISMMMTTMVDDDEEEKP